MVLWFLQFLGLHLLTSFHILQNFRIWDQGSSKQCFVLPPICLSVFHLDKHNIKKAQFCGMRKTPIDPRVECLLSQMAAKLNYLALVVMNQNQLIREIWDYIVYAENY